MVSVVVAADKSLLGDDSAVDVDADVSVDATAKW